jgi:SAM-dependent methyltransferase
MAKDLFSDQPALYAKYRPTAPKELYDHIYSFVNDFDTAWDCATGNGQAAVVLADRFKKIIASDISEAQMSEAPRRDNIEYVLSSGESTPFKENTFDLITVSQAYHWLDWAAFRQEASRVGKKGTVIAIWTFHRHAVEDDAVNKAVRAFYKDITEPYWEAERRFVDEKYETIEFDYEPLPSREFEAVLYWTRDDLLGYISTWSALKNYTKQHGSSLLPIIQKQLIQLWPGNEAKRVIFPVYMRMGRISK